MIKDDATEVETVKRRALFRSGAVLAGAAGLTVATGALAAAPAQAADNDSLKVGASNDAASSTSLTIGGLTGGDAAALALTNADGPSLYLNPLDNDWDGNLNPGQIVNTERGPLIGVTTSLGNLTTELLTDQDVWHPLVLPVPLRLLDTRSAEGRYRVMEPSPLLSDGRLPANTELTVGIIAAEDGYGLAALQVNLTVVKPTATGNAVIYPGPEKPNTSTLNFTKGKTIANAAFVGTSTEAFIVPAGASPTPEQDVIVVKISTTNAAWIVVDLNAVGETTAKNAGRTSTRPSPVALAQRALSKLK